MDFQIRISSSFLFFFFHDDDERRIVEDEMLSIQVCFSYARLFGELIDVLGIGCLKGRK